jgi:hypothetical protein
MAKTPITPMAKTTITQWDRLLVKNNAKYHNMTTEEKKAHLRVFMGEQKTTEREQREIQIQIDRLGELEK